MNYYVKYLNRDYISVRHCKKATSKQLILLIFILELPTHVFIFTAFFLLSNPCQQQGGEAAAKN
jgi:hypothetical protein